MTREEWRERAEEHRSAGVPLRIGADEYAELVRHRLCSDPANLAHHDETLFGVPLVVEG